MCGATNNPSAIPIFGPKVISWNQSLPNDLLMPYAGVKLISSPSPVLALNLIEMKSDELLYVLLPYSARLAIFEYHLLSNDNPIPICPVKVDAYG